jgi:hypothetical protein
MMAVQDILERKFHGNWYISNFLKINPMLSSANYSLKSKRIQISTMILSKKTSRMPAWHPEYSGRACPDISGFESRLPRELVGPVRLACANRAGFFYKR